MSPSKALQEEKEFKRGGAPGKFKAILGALGPGFITGSSDDDPSGIGTYAQTGAQFGHAQLWTSLFTFPLMTAIQEISARIALQTDGGLALALRKIIPSRRFIFVSHCFSSPILLTWAQTWARWQRPGNCWWAFLFFSG